MTRADELKIRLFDIMRRQGVLQQQYNTLEQEKQKASEELDAIEQAEREAKRKVDGRIDRPCLPGTDVSHP